MILLTGATGVSGRPIVRAAKARGATVRVMTRDPRRAGGDLPPGVEVVAGDFADAESLKRAMDGCDVAMFNSDGNPRLAQQQQAFVEAASAAGVQRVVRFSVQGASAESRLSFPRWHGEAEQVLKSSGLRWTMLQPTFFMENLLQSAGTVKAQNLLPMPAGDGKAAYVATDDIAAVAAVVLTESGHDQQSYVITGPADLGYADIARAIGEARGKPVQYVNIPPEALEQALAGMGLPDWRVKAVSELMWGTREGWMAGVSDVVPRLTGKPATILGQWAKAHVAAFI